jgi:hypothetical protein
VNFNVNFNVLLSKYIVHPLVKMKKILIVRILCRSKASENDGVVTRCHISIQQPLKIILLIV